MKKVKQALIILVIIIFIEIIIKPLSIKPNENPEITILNDENKEIMHYINYKEYTPINLSLIPKKNIDILLFIEDKKFYKHNGFNIQRITKTLVNNVINNELYGASTITQQYIKNVYLNNSKSLSRKIKELYYAIKIEKIKTKDEILTGYLNCIYLGNNIYGLANGSKYYFNKEYYNLTINEMISLITLLNSPSYYSNNIKNWNKRKNEIAKILYENNVISKIEYQSCLIDLSFNINDKIYPSNLMFFCESVIKEFKNLNIKSKFNQKIIIKTQYNNKLNNINISTNGNVASIAINKDGYILSCIGNTNYYNSPFNIVLNGKRDIGSTIKPLLYYEALKCGYSINKTYISSPFSFNYKNEIITINNYSNKYPNGKINMKIALATSDNIYAIKTHLDIGMKTLANHLEKYNIKTSPLPSLALGSVGMSLYDLSKIYTQFFTDGYYITPQFIEYIYVNNKIAYKDLPKSILLGNKNKFIEIKNIMNGLFNSNIPNSTAASIGSLLKSECYGKSGLTDYDSYMVGFNNNILIAVWSGHINNEPLQDLNLKRLPKEIFLQQINLY